MPPESNEPEEESINPEDQAYTIPVASSSSSHGGEDMLMPSLTKGEHTGILQIRQAPSPLSPSPSSVASSSVNSSRVTRVIGGRKTRAGPFSQLSGSGRIFRSHRLHHFKRPFHTWSRGLSQDGNRGGGGTTTGPSTPVPSWNACEIPMEWNTPKQMRMQNQSQRQVQMKKQNEVQMQHELQNQMQIQCDLENQVQDNMRNEVQKQKQKHLDSSKVVSVRRLAASLWESSIISPHSFSPSTLSRSSNIDHHQPQKNAARKVSSTPTMTNVMARGVTEYTSSKPDLKEVHLLEFSEEQSTLSTHLVTILQSELSQARSQLQMLMLNEKARCKAVENLTQKLAKERARRREKEEESIKIAIQSIKQELEEEKKSTQKLKLQLHNNKVEKELRECKRRLNRALEELEKEIKARRLMEDVCDELAREISDDKERVEEMKRESMKMRGEVEEERKMLQLADIWREERVQMKLTDAKLEMEAKNLALDKLRNDVEAFFMKAKHGGDEKVKPSVIGSGDGLARHFQPGDNPRMVNPVQKSTGSARDHELIKENDQRGCNIEDSEIDLEEAFDDDDLHSIELNKDRQSKWTHIPFHHFHQCEYDYRGKDFIDRRALLPNGHVNSEQNEVERGTKELQDYSCWIECTGNESEKMRDWSLKEHNERSIKSWQNMEQHLSSLNPNVKVRNMTKAYRRASLYDDTNDNLLIVRDPLHIISSPVRQWNH